MSSNAKWILGASCALGWVVACGSSDGSKRKAAHQAGGSAGKAGSSASGTAGRAPTSGRGGTAGGDAGRGGKSGKAGGGSGGTGGKGGSSGKGGSGNSAGGAAGDSAGEGGNGAAGAGGEGGANGTPPQVVSAFGCFAVSGDGWETLENGEPAVILAGEAARCGGVPISDNAFALSSEQTPTTIRFARHFVLDSDLVESTGEFALSFAADDQATFVLNGETVASCVPDPGNPPECSATCQNFVIPRERFLGDGQVNTLEIELVNLVSVPAGNGTFGWTSMLYSLCVESEDS
jgi:hypothetical protein